MLSSRPNGSAARAVAAIVDFGFAGEMDAAAYTRNVLLNSAAPQVLGDAFLRAAARTEASCQLVNISSGAANNAYAGWSSYCAGKAAADQWAPRSRHHHR